MLTTSADSFFMKKFGLYSADKAFILLPFHWMLMLQVRAEIVTSP